MSLTLTLLVVAQAVLVRAAQAISPPDVQWPELALLLLLAPVPTGAVAVLERVSIPPPAVA